MITADYFDLNPVYQGCRNKSEPLYKPELEIKNKGNKGGFTFPWYQRDLILMMLNVMNLPIKEVADGAGVHVKTIRKFMAERNIERDFTKVNRVSLELNRNKTIQKYIDSEHKSSYYVYLHMCRQLTRCLLNRWRLYIDPKDKLSKGYVIEHRVSIKEAYYVYDKLPLTIVNHPRNLKVISRFENCSKGDSSSINVSTLKRRIDRDNKIYDPFLDFHLP